MKKHILSVFAMAVLSLTTSNVVFASGQGNHGNRGNQNGAGGVGVGVGVGVGIGGNALVTNDVHNTVDIGVNNKVHNDVKNINNNRQGQLQFQNQQQQIKNSGNSFNVNANKNVNNNTATGGSVGNITINAYDPNAADATRDAANTQARAQVDAAAASPTEFEIKTPGIASVPNIYPTSPCMGSTSAGVSFMGGAFSGGTSWKDDDCGLRETARVFYQSGSKDDAIAVMCESQYAKAAPSCKNLADKRKTVEAQSQIIAELQRQVEDMKKQQVVTRESDRTSENDKRRTDATVRSFYDGRDIDLSNVTAPKITEMVVNEEQWIWTSDKGWQIANK